MYCPSCGQQQISDEMRFCSRCGLALSGLADWLAGGRALATDYQAAVAKRDDPQLGISPRRKKIRRAQKLMFFSGVLFPIFLVISIAVNEGGPIAVPLVLFFVSLVMMLYARHFSDNTVPNTNQSVPQPSNFGQAPPREYLPPQTTNAIPNVGRHRVRTNELAQPPSVTDHTTKLLDD